MWAIGMRNVRATAAGRERFVAICDQEQQIRPQLSQQIRQTKHRDTEGLGHADVGVGAEQALNSAGDRKPICLNGGGSFPELGRKVSSQHNQF